MKIELFINFDCESSIFCEQIRSESKDNIFTKPFKMMFFQKVAF